MTEIAAATDKPAKPSTREALGAAFRDRQVLAMLILGFASGLPYSAIVGTLNAWLTTVDVKPTAIGLLSWVTLAYSFKFMWAAALQGRRTPLGLNMGPKRFWMGLFLLIGTVGMFFLSLSNPPSGLNRIALIGLLIAVASASFDIVVAGWRIEVARDDTHLDILSAVEQFGYRTSTFVGGFIALLLADKIGWRPTFLFITSLLALSIVGVFLAQKTMTEETHIEAGGISAGLSATQRSLATLLVLAGWGVALYLLGDFMFAALEDPETNSARAFVRGRGLWIIGLTIFWLIGIAAALVWMRGQGRTPGEVPEPPKVLAVLYRAILEPMMELIARLRWSVLLVLAVVLTYRFTDLIWGSFAYPFYLGENYGALGHTLTEVGFASKLIGVFAIIVGIALGGLAMLRFGRMPVFFFGAVLAAATNLLFADLAVGARFTDPVITALQIDHLFAAFGMDIRMARLTSVIAVENIAVGLASAASVAYLSSVVSKRYAVVQYALLASLIMLLGTLFRPAIGELIETDGFATAFIVCAALGGVASVLALLEWIRIARNERAENG